MDKIGLAVAATVLLTACGQRATGNGQRGYDLVLKNGWIVDGSGNPRYRGDVAVRGDRIAAVLPLGLYFQRQLGFSAVHAGLGLAPSPLVSLFVSPLAAASATGRAAAGCCWPAWCPSARGCSR